jgi:hypothetical protein
MARSNPVLRPFVWPILGCYLAFALMTWLAYPLFNLLLRLNRFGRYALSVDQTRGANVLLACLVVTLSLAAAALVTGTSALWYGVLLFALLSLPASSIYRCEEGWPRRTAALMTFGLLAASVVVVVGTLIPAESLGPAGAKRLEALGGALLFAMIASQFASNYLTSVRAKR